MFKHKTTIFFISVFLFEKDLIDDEDEDVNIFIFGYDVVFVRDEYLSFFEELGAGFNKD